MLHSALPRAYLATPGYGLGPYFEDALQPFVPYVTHQLHHPHDDSYARLSEQRVLAWDTSMSTLAEQQRCAPTPFPLDLSLKPTTSTADPKIAAEDSCETIEVDDEEDRRSREEIRSHHSHPLYYETSSRQDMEEDVVVDDVDSQRSFSSGHSYPLHSTPVKRPEPLLVPPGLTPPASALSPVYYPDHHQKPLILSPRLSPSHHHLQAYQMRGPEPLAREAAGHHHFQGLHAPMTPPNTPSPPQQQHQPHNPHKRKEPSSPRMTPDAKRLAKSDKPRAKKKHVRKLKFDEETSSPVSGTVILAPDEVDVCGEIDKFNIVEVTDEARAKMAEIENRLGPYQCKLCKQLHEDAFQLAQHRCRRIANVEYRCLECHKQFNCPANLASHQRWHKVKPRPQQPQQQQQQLDPSEVACTRCDLKFPKQSALKKHMVTQHPEHNNNNQVEQNLAGPALSPEMA